MSIQGILILNNTTGNLVYEEDFTGYKFGLIPELDPHTPNIVGGSGEHSPHELSVSMYDPMNLASQFFAILKVFENIQHLSAIPPIHTQYPKNKMAFTLVHYDKKQLPLSLLLITKNMSEKEAIGLSTKILKNFVTKYTLRLQENIKYGSYKSFRKTLQTIYSEYIQNQLKFLALDLSSMSLYVPWIYILFDHERYAVAANREIIHQVNNTHQDSSTNFTSKKSIEKSNEHPTMARNILRKARMGESLLENVERYSQRRKLTATDCFKLRKIKKTKRIPHPTKQPEDEIEFLVRFEIEDLEEQKVPIEHGVEVSVISNELEAMESCELKVKSSAKVDQVALRAIKETVQAAEKLLTFQIFHSQKPINYLEIALNKKNIMRNYLQ